MVKSLIFMAEVATNKGKKLKNTSNAARNSHLYAVVPGHLISHNTLKTCIFAMVGAKRSAGVHV